MNTHTDIERMSSLLSEVYPYIAGHITNKFGIKNGYCLDIGAGAGSLGIALAKITDLHVISLDKDPAAIDVTIKNIIFEGMAHRMMAIRTDVHNIPFTDNTFDIIVSRGSVFSWEDIPGAIKEMYRLLKPKGIIFCGGGLGSPEISKRIQEKLTKDIRYQQTGNGWRENPNGRNKGESTALFVNAIASTGIKGRVVFDCDGIWMEITK
jgi:ubiquinone/menaquinone biosynthesis C-methylase UbiE